MLTLYTVPRSLFSMGSKPCKKGLKLFENLEHAQLELDLFSHEVNMSPSDFKLSEKSVFQVMSQKINQFSKIFTREEETTSS